MRLSLDLINHVYRNPCLEPYAHLPSSLLAGTAVEPSAFESGRHSI